MMFDGNSGQEKFKKKYRERTREKEREREREKEREITVHSILLDRFCTATTIIIKIIFLRPVYGYPLGSDRSG